MQLLDHALAYAEAGWPVFPCSPNDKRPLTPAADKDAAGEPIEGTGGLYHATTSEAQIRAWWRKWPNAMIGLPTGETIGAFVVDLDPKDGETAEGLLARIAEAVGGSLPPCPMVRTPRGGLHIYFAMPEGAPIGNRANCVFKGVDVRGTGGYVIAPPSVRSGTRALADGCDGAAYRWEVDSGLEDFDPPAPPAELVRFVTDRDFGCEGAPPRSARTSPGAPYGGGGDDRRAEAVRKFALAAFDAEVRAVAECARGGRNDQLNLAAFALGQLAGAGVLTQAACAAALEEAASGCGLVKDDGMRSVRATIRSGLKGGMSNSRDLTGVGTRAGSSRSWDERPPPPDEPPPGPGAPKRRGRKHTRGSRQAGRSGGGGGKPPSSTGEECGDDGPDPEITAACVAEPLNDTGNARRMIAHFGRDMLRVRQVGAHWWTGTHWEPDGGDEAFQRWAQRTAEHIAFEADYIDPTARQAEAIDAAAELKGIPFGELNEEQKAVLKAGLSSQAAVYKRRGDRRKFAISCGNSNRIAGMIKQAEPHITVAPEELDTDPLAINVANGTLRIVREKRVETLGGDGPDDPPLDVERRIWRERLDEHRREDRIAKVMPVEYAWDAVAPKWESFMARFQPKQGIRDFLKRYHGYALTGLAGEQIFVFNYGLGANGKSTFMEALRRLQGDYAKILSAESLTGDSHRRGDQATPEFARLPGARMVVCSELPRGHGFRESTLKMLTGGEAMLVRHLHQGFFEFNPIFKPVGSGNDRPSIGGVDEGIWRRMKLVPWEVRIEAAERRPMEKVLAKFAEEGPGILNWLLDGLLDYLENGLQVPPEIDAATESYRGDMDPVGEFARACIEAAAGEHVTARDTYLAYTAWCHANSVKPYSEKGFAGIMVQKGFEREIGRIRKYLNVRLKDVPDDPEERQDYPPGYGGGYD